MTETQAGERLPDKRDAPADRTQFPCFDGYRAIAAMSRALVPHRLRHRLHLRDHAFGLLVLPAPPRPRRRHLLPRVGLPALPALRRRPLRAAARARRAVVLPAPAAAHPARVLGRAHGDRLRVRRRTRRAHRRAGSPIFYGLAQIYVPGRALGGIGQAWSLCHRAELLRLPPDLRVGARAQARGRPRRQLRVELVGRAGAVRVERRLSALRRHVLSPTGPR